MNMRKAVIRTLNVIFAFVGIVGVLMMGVLPPEYQPVLLVLCLGSLAFLVVALILLQEGAPGENSPEREEKLKNLAKRFAQAGTLADLGVLLYRKVGFTKALLLALGMMFMPVLSHFDMISPDVTWFVALLGFFVLVGVLVANKT